VEGGSRAAIVRRNFDEGIDSLVGDLKKLVAGSI
jgi:hypothetical protein